MGLGGKTDAVNWTIETVSADDYDEIVQVWVDSGLSVRRRGRDTRDAFEQQLAVFPDLYLKAVAQMRIIGVILGTHDQRKGWINRLAVLPVFRRQGVAVALVTACDRAIRAQGIGIVSALVETESKASAALFERLGYRSDVPVRYFRRLDHPDI